MQIKYREPIILYSSVTGINLICQSHASCRVCKHLHLSQINKTKPKESYDYCVENYAIQSHVPCNCKEYVPEDNLEYLEWLNDKK